MLNPGRNNISITASAKGGTVQFKFTIYYYGSAVPGASYKVDRLHATGKIEAFNRLLPLVYLGKTVLFESSGKPVEESITFSVYGYPAKATQNFNARRADLLYFSEHNF
jgi:hypothetical protein